MSCNMLQLSILHSGAFPKSVQIKSQNILISIDQNIILGKARNRCNAIQSVFLLVSIVIFPLTASRE